MSTPFSHSPADIQPQPQPAVPDFSTVQRGGLHPDQVRQWAAATLHRLAEAERAVAELAGKLAHAAGKEAETPQGQKMLAELMKIAVEELTGQQATAAADAERLINQATAQKDSIISAAEEEADSLVNAAHEQAATILSGARSEAKQQLDAASVRSAAVAEGADRRLQALTAQHAETIRRITEINKVTGGLLAGEQERGSLSDEVDRVMPATAAVQASARPQLTASGTADSGAGR